MQIKFWLNRQSEEETMKFLVIAKPPQTATSATIQAARERAKNNIKSGITDCAYFLQMEAALSQSPMLIRVKRLQSDCSQTDGRRWRRRFTRWSNSKSTWRK